MNYVLQVVRGRSTSTTLKLADGVTSIGRHDDCLIRIKSSQVSRRHCEVFAVLGQLTIRDLGSSNGTFVNGKKVAGEQILRAGDELTVGAVTLRVAKIGQPVPPAARVSQPKAADTAVREAVSALPGPEQDEFEIEFDDGDPLPEVDGIPLVDDEPKQSAKAKAGPTPVPAAASPTTEPGDVSSTSSDPKEDDAVAQFLLDLKLDDGD